MARVRKPRGELAETVGMNSYDGALTGWVSTVVLSLFFFQAEDGIRDLTVTGVQTCALPISRRPAGHRARRGVPGRRPSTPRRARCPAGRRAHPAPAESRGRAGPRARAHGEIGRASCRERV